ncbi:hypothetical protein BJ508DRAFT_188816, partial [Ascobolus immersus RN42]
NINFFGFLAVVKSSTLQKYTAITGSPDYFSYFILCPGIADHQNAPDLSKGEVPVCVDMWNGQVSQIWNEGTVHFLQMISEPNHVTYVRVGPSKETLENASVCRAQRNDAFCSIITGICALITAQGFYLLILRLHDYNAWAACLVLSCAHAINFYIAKRRMDRSAKIEPDNNTQRNLLIRLNQSRFVILRGWPNDIKNVTATPWLARQTCWEEMLSTFATGLVYLTPFLMANATGAGTSVFVGMMLLSLGFL